MGQCLEEGGVMSGWGQDNLEGYCTSLTWVEN